jgi:TonB family protein
LAPENREENKMLDQLVESKNNTRETTRRSGFLATTFVIMTTLMLGGWLYSLYGKDYGLGSGDLELSTLVAPVPVAEEEPPPPPEKEPEQKIVKAAPNADVRKEIIQDMSESPIKPPDKISNEKQDIPPRRPDRLTIKGDTNITANDAVASNYKGAVSTNGKGIAGDGGIPNSGSQTGGTTPPPPPPPPAPKKEEPPPPKVAKKISGGVLNGKATSLPKPPYPAAARAVRASGAVNVQVTISESGSVVSASAVSGHPLLKQAAVAAARQARFAPTTLSGQAVSVSGIIVYNFIAP